MTRQFKRNVKVVISTFAVEYTIPNEFEIAFDILLRRNSEPNTAVIRMYNLAQATRDAMRDEQDYASIQVYAGYGDSEPDLVFAGTVANIVNHKVNRHTWETVIYAGDGTKEFDKAYFNKTYDDGIILDTIIQDIANALNLEIYSNVPELLFVKTLRPVTLSGKAKACMDMLARDYDFQWSIQLGALEITAKGEPPSREQTAVVLSANSGMLGSPTISWSKKKKNKASKPQFVSTVKVRSNLNAEIKPNRFIEIRAEQTEVNYGALTTEVVPSTDANGQYIVDQVKYRANNKRGAYEVEVIADGR